MSNKARRMLVLLLIILKEAGPTAACSSSCSSHCDCSIRGLTSVPQDLPTDITTLDLEDNAITTLNQSDFLSLWLSNNQLTSLPADIFVGLGNLQTLTLSVNKLRSLPADIFNGLGNLQLLGLYSNKLTGLSSDIFAGVSDLRSLTLSYNQLTSLPSDIFEGLGNLQRLWLQTNQLTSLSADIIEGFGNLQTLWLNNNKLETLPPTAYDILASISTVNIVNNPWQCDCRMAPFKQKMNGSYPFEDQMICAGPANLKGQLLRNVTLHPDDLICEETTPVYSTSSTKHMVDSTLSLSPVSSSSPFHQSVSKAPTLSPTQSYTPTTDSTPGWFTVSSSPPFNPSSTKSESRAPTLSPIQSNTPTADSNPGWSTVRTDSPSTFQSTMTESNTGTADGGIVLPLPLLATLCTLLGLFIIFTIAVGVWCVHKRRQGDPSPQVDINSQSGTSNLGNDDSQHAYNIPTDDDPETVEYETIGEINQSENPYQSAENRQSLDSFGYLVLPPSLPPENQTGPRADSHIESADAAARAVSGRDTWTDEADYDDVVSPSQTSQPGSGQMQHLDSFNNSYQFPSPSLYPGEGPQSHKYVNSQVTAAAKDAAAGPQVTMHENDEESVDNQSQTAAAPGADSPHHYEPLRNPSSQQHTYTSLMPHGLQNQ
ncbi:hypothetical protein Bbelb_121900 [Branchiostoma belcheri]|nr:hypothetical protein Bbelb_121900 [Branchiostoma belcheri]